MSLSVKCAEQRIYYSVSSLLSLTHLRRHKFLFQVTDTREVFLNTRNISKEGNRKRGFSIFKLLPSPLTKNLRWLFWQLKSKKIIRLYITPSQKEVVSAWACFCVNVEISKDKNNVVAATWKTNNRLVREKEYNKVVLNTAELLHSGASRRSHPKLSPEIKK